MTDMPRIVYWLLGLGGPVTEVLELEGEERTTMVRRIFLLLTSELVERLELRLSYMEPSLAALALEVLELCDLPWQAPRQAPATWKPPEAPDGLPRLEGWRVREQADDRLRFEVIRADGIYNHPIIVDGRRVQTSPLLWIDAPRKYAHTASRLYRLGGEWSRTLH